MTLMEIKCGYGLLPPLSDRPKIREISKEEFFAEAAKRKQEVQPIIAQHLQDQYQAAKNPQG